MSTARPQTSRDAAASSSTNIPRAQLILEHADALAVPQVIASGMLETLDNSTVTNKSLAVRALRSPEITAFIIRLAASNSPDAPSSLEDAIEQVGRRDLGRMLTSRATYRLTSDTMPFYDITRAGFLRHASEVADMSNRAAHALAIGPLSDRAALGGALHDIGKLVLASIAGSTILSRREALTDEREAFGVDHARVGAWLGQRWGFPADVCRAIAQHHSTTPPAGAVERSVWLGNLLVRASEGDNATLRTAQGGFEASGLPGTAFDQLMVGGGPAEGHRRPPGLTDREVQILRLLAEGETAKQVAHRLGCAASTVHNHLHHVYRKLGVSGQTQALLIARENNWV